MLNLFKTALQRFSGRETTPPATVEEYGAPEPIELSSPSQEYSPKTVALKEQEARYMVEMEECRTIAKAGPAKSAASVAKELFRLDRDTLYTEAFGADAGRRGQLRAYQMSLTEDRDPLSEKAIRLRKTMLARGIMQTPASRKAVMQTLAHAEISLSKEQQEVASRARKIKSMNKRPEGVEKALHPVVIRQAMNAGLSRHRVLGVGCELSLLYQDSVPPSRHVMGVVTDYIIANGGLMNDDLRTDLLVSKEVLDNPAQDMRKSRKVAELA